MSSLKRTGLIIGWVLSIVAAAVWGYAQAPWPPGVMPLATPSIVAGGDVGFRIEARRGETPVGRVVIRKDGQSPWVDVEFAIRQSRGIQ